MVCDRRNPTPGVRERDIAERGAEGEHAAR